jgi:hypothetical protein
LHPCKRIIGVPHRRGAGRTTPVGDFHRFPLMCNHAYAWAG